MTIEGATGSARMAGEERRLQILAVAVSLFSQKGFRGTTTKEIAQAAGVSEAMVFRHFATKQELYSAILDHKACASGRFDPAETAADLSGPSFQSALHDQLGIKLQSIEVRSPADFENAFKAGVRKQAGALLVLQSAVTNTHRKSIAELATKNRWPTMWGESGLLDAGGLMSYGPNYADLFRRAATYVDKILKGAKPADLPVEQPKKFEFIINLKAAKQIGLTIPPNVLARADRVIR